MKESWILRKGFVQGLIATAGDKVELVVKSGSDSFLSRQIEEASVTSICFLTIMKIMR